MPPFLRFGPAAVCITRRRCLESRAAAGGIRHSSGRRRRPTTPPSSSKIQVNPPSLLQNYPSPPFHNHTTRTPPHPINQTLMVAVVVMGLSVSLLSATTILFMGAGFFAFGYFLALNSIDDDDKQLGKPRLLSWARSLLAKVNPRHRSTGGGGGGDVQSTKQSKLKKPSLLEIENLAEILEDFKMVLVVRNDLKMGKGKIAAQCSHATLGLYKKLLHRAPKSLNRWEMCGQVKVVLKIESEEDMFVLQERAKSLKLPTHITIEAGRFGYVGCAVEGNKGDVAEGVVRWLLW